MKIRPLVIAASVAALCACNNSQTNTSANNSSSGNSSAGLSGGTAATGSTSGGATSGREVDPALAQQLSMAVQALKSQLPMRQGPVTVTNIEARGGELVYTMEVPTDLDQNSFQQFQTQLPVQACANAQARDLFSRGGSYTYILKDPGGEEFTTSVSSC